MDIKKGDIVFWGNEGQGDIIRWAKVLDISLREITIQPRSSEGLTFKSKVSKSKVSTKDEIIEFIRSL